MFSALYSLMIIFKKYKFLLSEQKKEFIFITIITLAEAFIPLMQIYSLKVVTDEIVLVIQEKHELSRAILFIFAQVILILTTSVLTSVKNLIRMRIDALVSYKFDEITSLKCGKLPFVYYDNSENYDHLEKASNGIGSKMVSSYMTFLEVAKAFITLSGYVFMLFAVHWSLIFILIIFIIPSFYTQHLVSKWSYIQISSQTYLMRRASYLNNQLRNRATNKELKFFNHYYFLLNYWSKSFLKTVNDKYLLEKKTTKVNLMVFSFDSLATNIFSIILLWIGTKGKLTVGDYVAMSQILSMSVSSIQALSNNFGAIIKDSFFIKDFDYFMSLEEENTPERTLTIKFPLNRGIEVKNLSFKYPNSEDRVLKNISFNVQPGEKVAIVGVNGSGKSTLVKCLTSLYKIDSGQILYDGIDINSVNPSKLRQNITVVFQDFVQYQLSLKENITFKEQLTELDLERLNHVIQESGLKDLVDKLPNGVETPLGSTLQGGIELSGGQWQKVGLARALFRNSDIIILDEPTAALDPLAETELLSKFMKMVEIRTSFIITHRLGSCINADKILVLDDGQIIESGTHEELMVNGNKYSKMFKSQADWYKSKS
ncbi:ABC transporter ATP-binding protein [Paenibacillus sp. 481]|uniref:ABC transporter ATP-binding protein n=1 Tax=Paenibacillus sp. 481 TaxID=2835869 RepID=UPI001E3FFCA3|nr:ABC transporter ATP-binding protein [Paenibacillus sp. 481]UHA75190.1 ABC transporter ATP-binding protein [Paenibacillus sp. 481]